MGLTRRTLLGSALAALGATPILPLLLRWLPPRPAEALRQLVYPGRVRPLDLDDVRKEAQWLG